MSQPVPGYGPWQSDDVRIPKRGVPWYVIVLGLTAIAVLVLAVVGFWIAGSTIPRLPI
jgi:hypothetical protein